ncbi:hypothetical protein AVEN_93682-1 [Araneus ventricosus]|uniref:Uncharacterized protein n=1 Tax=Araneus ventricosus TaxID=182803 RepID=A0A4Y2V2A4_ARAVE|nr:hypothetical protein AVEN_93682-1 [Araneus ventricosus]
MRPEEPGKPSSHINVLLAKIRRKYYSHCSNIRYCCVDDWWTDSTFNAANPIDLLHNKYTILASKKEVQKPHVLQEAKALNTHLHSISEWVNVYLPAEYYYPGLSRGMYDIHPNPRQKAISSSLSSHFKSLPCILRFRTALL